MASFHFSEFKQVWNYGYKQQEALNIRSDSFAPPLLYRIFITAAYLSTGAEEPNKKNWSMRL